MVVVRPKGANNSFLPVSESNPVLPLISAGLDVLKPTLFEINKFQVTQAEVVPALDSSSFALLRAKSGEIR